MLEIREIQGRAREQAHADRAPVDECVDLDRFRGRILLVGGDSDDGREGLVLRQRVAELTGEGPAAILARLRSGRRAAWCRLKLASFIPTRSALRCSTHLLISCHYAAVLEPFRNVEVELRLIRVLAAVLHRHVHHHRVILRAEQELLSVSEIGTLIRRLILERN